jgi:hypothetical protein
MQRQGMCRREYRDIKEGEVLVWVQFEGVFFVVVIRYRTKHHPWCASFPGLAAQQQQDANRKTARGILGGYNYSQTAGQSSRQLGHDGWAYTKDKTSSLHPRYHVRFTSCSCTAWAQSAEAESTYPAACFHTGRTGNLPFPRPTPAPNQPLPNVSRF